MTIGKSAKNFLNRLIRYGLWTVGICGVFGLSIFFGASLRAYNNQPSWELPCVWQYEEDTTLEVPYRKHRMAKVYDDAFDDGIDAWDDADTPAEFDRDTGQNKHSLGVKNEPEDSALGRTDYWCLALLNKRSWTYAWLNSAHLGNYTDSYKGAVATHELGHYIGAGHSTESPAIMNVPIPLSYSATVYEDDECAINDRYEHEDYEVTCDD